MTPEIQGAMPLSRYVVQAAQFSHWGWLLKRTGAAATSDFSAIEAVDSRGVIRGMVGYSNTTPNAIQIHIAVESPSVWRSLLVPGLWYPFVQADKGICLGVIPADNAKSCRFARSVGFREVHRIKNGWSQGVDMVVHQLNREDCRYINGLGRRAA